MLLEGRVMCEYISIQKGRNFTLQSDANLNLNCRLVVNLSILPDLQLVLSTGQE